MTLLNILALLFRWLAHFWQAQFVLRSIFPLTSVASRLVLASESNYPFVGSPVVDEETWGQATVAVRDLCFIQCFDTWLGDRKDIGLWKNPLPLISSGSLLEQVKEENLWRTTWLWFTWKTAVKQRLATTSWLLQLQCYGAVEVWSSLL